MGVERQAEVVGNDHRLVWHDFQMSEVVHRVDVAVIKSTSVVDLYAIGGVVGTDLYNGPGEGRWALYNEYLDSIYHSGSLGEGIRTVRVADGCPYGTTSYSWYAYEDTDGSPAGVVIARLSSSGAWQGSTLISGATSPTVVLGRDASGEQKVLLLYQRTSGDRSYLYYRFLWCDGTVGAPYAIRSVGSPWSIWHIEAAFSPFAIEEPDHLEHWRIFWDETALGEAEETQNCMRTKWIDWDGVHCSSTYLLDCDHCPDALAAEAGEAEAEEQEYAPWECEDYDYPATDQAEAGVLSLTEGCKRFFASFDPTADNGTQRYAVSTYAGQAVRLISEVPAIVYERPGEFSTPLSGTCDVGTCSYQEIRKTGGSTYWRLTHDRFRDTNSSCDTEDEITPDVYQPYPLAIAGGQGTAVVLYTERVGGDLDPDDVYLTVIDN